MTYQGKLILLSTLLVLTLGLLLITTAGLSSYLVTRLSPLPQTSESLVGGQLNATHLVVGENTLTFRAKTQKGQTVTDEVRFVVEGGAALGCHPACFPGERCINNNCAPPPCSNDLICSHNEVQVYRPGAECVCVPVACEDLHTFPRATGCNLDGSGMPLREQGCYHVADEGTTFSNQYGYINIPCHSEGPICTTSDGALGTCVLVPEHEEVLWMGQTDICEYHYECEAEFVVPEKNCSMEVMSVASWNGRHNVKLINTLPYTSYLTNHLTNACTSESLISPVVSWGVGPAEDFEIYYYQNQCMQPERSAETNSFVQITNRTIGQKLLLKRDANNDGIYEESAELAPGERQQFGVVTNIPINPGPPHYALPADVDVDNIKASCGPEPCNYTVSAEVKWEGDHQINLFGISSNWRYPATGVGWQYDEPFDSYAHAYSKPACGDTTEPFRWLLPSDPVGAYPPSPIKYKIDRTANFDFSIWTREFWCGPDHDGNGSYTPDNNEGDPTIPEVTVRVKNNNQYRPLVVTHQQNQSIIPRTDAFGTVIDGNSNVRVEIPPSSTDVFEVLTDNPISDDVTGYIYDANGNPIHDEDYLKIECWEPS